MEPSNLRVSSCKTYQTQTAYRILLRDVENKQNSYV